MAKLFQFIFTSDFLFYSIDAIFVFLLIPILRELWWKGRTTYRPLTRSEKYIVNIFLIMSIVTVVALNFYRGPKVVTDFNLFTQDEFLEEIAELTAGSALIPISPLDLYQMRFLKEVFSRGNYAAENKDYQIASLVFEQLNTGEYDGEKIPQINSICVKNNLAICKYLFSPHDKDQFIGSAKLLGEALQLAKTRPQKKYKDKIDRNYRILLRNMEVAK